MASSPSAASPRVGLIGLGRMGTPIAGRLLDRGVALTVYNRSPAKAAALAARGATVADSPRALGVAIGDGVLLTLLTDARAVRSVLFGRGGAATGLRPGALVVDLSTIAPEESRAIAARLATRGIDFVDAPLGGSTDAAAAGSLLSFAGGTPPAVDRARPLLTVFARRVERLGPVGAGSSMKLVNNLLTIGHVVLAGEAVALGEALGLERERVLDLLLDGGGNSRMLALKRSQFGRRAYPTQFALALAAKDLGLVASAARSVGGAAPLARALRRTAEEAIRAGHGGDDFSAVFEASLRHFARTAPAAPAPDPA